MKKTAIIVAGGTGARMGTQLPKQFLLLAGKPVLWYTLQRFLESFSDVEIVLVLPEAHWELGNQLLEAYFPSKAMRMVVGGSTRFESVRNGLQTVEPGGIVFVHDGVRCLLSPLLIQRCYQQALEYGSAIPAVVATDSIRVVSGSVNQVADRNQIRLIQTPQTFRTDLLQEAFGKATHNQYTDEATVVEAMGMPVYLLDGEYENIKITRPTDLLLAAAIIQQSSSLDPS
jgi:2-C-methyl-D-erythritol 4-phosphate cytidylyltransferase